MVDREGSREPGGVSMREAMEVVCGNFRNILLNAEEPFVHYRRKEASYLSSPFGDNPNPDPFGDFGLIAWDLFMTSTRDFLHANSDRMSISEAAHIDVGMNISGLGLSTMAVFLELPPLVYLRENPSAELDSDDAVRIAKNSFDFIDTIIKAGRRAGTEVVDQLLKPKVILGKGRRLRGAVLDGELRKPERVESFQLVATPDGLDAKVEATSMNELISSVHATITSPADKAVTCLAHVHKHPGTGNPYSRELFEAIADYAGRHLYPDFIPLARSIMAARQESAKTSVPRTRGLFSILRG